MDDLGFPASTRITAQGMLVPSDTAIRIYSIFYESSSTPTNMVFANASGTVTTTASPASVYLRINSTDGYGLHGDWENALGLRFPNGVFVATSTDFSYAVISYVSEK